MGLATRGPGFCKPDVVRHDWELAKELGVNITVHVAMDRFGYTKGQITALRDMDLLYPGTTYVHASHFTDEEWTLVRDSGGNVSFAPQIEIQMGHGWAPAVTAVEFNVPIGLSSDVATTASADQFTQMHAIFGSSAPSAAASTRSRGTATSTGWRPRPDSSPRARSSPGRRSGARRWRGSRIAPDR
jgi:5-methylthioadenosine/S-adenosylhomocysteine deaminase